MLLVGAIAPPRGRAEDKLPPLPNDFASQFEPLSGHATGLLVSEGVAENLGVEGRSSSFQGFCFARGEGSYRWLMIPSSKPNAPYSLKDFAVPAGEKGDQQNKFPLVAPLTMETAKSIGIDPPFVLADVEINGGSGAPDDGKYDFIATQITVLSKTDKYPLDPAQVMAAATDRLYAARRRQLADIDQHFEKLARDWPGPAPLSAAGPLKERTFITWIPDTQRIQFRRQIFATRTAYVSRPLLGLGDPPLTYGTEYQVESNFIVEYSATGAHQAERTLPSKDSIRVTPPPLPPITVRNSSEQLSPRTTVTSPLPGKTIGVFVSDIQKELAREGRSGLDGFGFSTNGSSYRWVYFPCDDKSHAKTYWDSLQMSVGAGGAKTFSNLFYPDDYRAQAMGLTRPFTLAEVEVNDGLGSPEDTSFVVSKMRILDRTSEYPLDPVVVAADALERLAAFHNENAADIENRIHTQAKEHGIELTGPRELTTAKYITWIPDTQRVRIRLEATITDGAYDYGFATVTVRHGRFSAQSKIDSVQRIRFGTQVGVTDGIELEYSKSGKLESTTYLPRDDFSRDLPSPPVHETDLVPVPPQSFPAPRALPASTIGLLVAGPDEQTRNARIIDEPANRLWFASGEGNDHQIVVPASQSQDPSNIHNFNVLVTSRNPGQPLEELSFPNVTYLDANPDSSNASQPPFQLVRVEINGGKGCPNSASAFVATQLTHLNAADGYTLDPVQIMHDAADQFAHYKTAQTEAIKTAIQQTAAKSPGAVKFFGPDHTNETIHLTWLPEKQCVQIHYTLTTATGAYTNPRKDGPLDFTPGKETLYWVQFGVESGLVLDYSKDGKCISTEQIRPKPFRRGGPTAD